MTCCSTPLERSASSIAPRTTPTTWAASPSPAPLEGDALAGFDELRIDPELTAEREAMERDFEREPDKTLAFVSQMPILYGDGEVEASSYECPMHPEVTSSEPWDVSAVRDEARCPLNHRRPTSYVCPMHPEVTASRAGDLSEVRDEAGSLGLRSGVGCW